MNGTKLSSCFWMCLIPDMRKWKAHWVTSHRIMESEMIERKNKFSCTRHIFSTLSVLIHGHSPSNNGSCFWLRSHCSPPSEYFWMWASWLKTLSVLILWVKKALDAYSSCLEWIADNNWTIRRDVLEGMARCCTRLGHRDQALDLADLLVILHLCGFFLRTSNQTQE